MYKLLKEAGYGTNVTIANTDTKASVIIGRVNSEIIRTVEEDMSITLDRTNSWDIEITKDVATKLQMMTLRMKKPIRNQRRVKSEQMEGKVDALDVLLGLASYSKKGDE